MASRMATKLLRLVSLRYCVFTKRKAVLFNIYVEYNDQVSILPISNISYLRRSYTVLSAEGKVTVINDLLSLVNIVNDGRYPLLRLILDVVLCRLLGSAFSTAALLTTEDPSFIQNIADNLLSSNSQSLVLFYLTQLPQECQDKRVTHCFVF